MTITIAPPTPRLLWTLGGVAWFIAATVGANVATDRYGLIPVGFGLTATAGTYAAGLVLVLRDWVHDTTGRVGVLACIAVGALASAATTGPRLAVASAAAFVLSETADMLVYTPLRRHGWIRAVLASNTVGAAVDTLLFLYLAGFTVTAAVVAGQLTAKTTATLIVIAVVGAVRALLRHRVQSPGA